MVRQALRFLRGQPPLCAGNDQGDARLSDAQEYDQARIVREPTRSADPHDNVVPNNTRIPEADVFALVYRQGVSCVQLIAFVKGSPAGREFLFSDTTPQDAEDIMTTVVKAMYAQNPLPHGLFSPIP